MSRVTLKPIPLTAEGFADYGEVIEVRGTAPKPINYGQTDRYDDLAQIDVSRDGGRPLLSIFRSRPVSLPFQVRLLERHPLGSQAFFPLHRRPFLVVVAGGNEMPDEDSVQVFITDGRQGVSYAPGTWHHYQLSLDRDSDYLVIDRGGPGNNCDEVQLESTIVIGAD